MQSDPLLITIVAIALVISATALILRRFNQPHVITYILAGVLLGPSVLGIVEPSPLLSQAGNLGIILLLFFIGMQIDLRHLVANWKIAVVGSVAQAALTVLVMLMLAHYTNIRWEVAVLLGFVFVVSSSAVVIKILQDWREINTNVGQNVLSITLVHDLLVIPMLVIIGILGSVQPSVHMIGLNMLGAALAIGIIMFILLRGSMRLPFIDRFRGDTEAQVFFALIVCFGMSLLATAFGLSAALGAFIAGIVVASARETSWMGASLDPLRVVLLALFFLYIGIIIDIGFIGENIVLVLVLAIAVFILNTVLGALVLRWLGVCWKEAVYSGAMLAEIGEFGFILGAAGLSQGLLREFDYQIIVSLISITLLLSPLYIMAVKRVLHIDAQYVFETLPRLRHRIRKTLDDKMGR